MMPPSQHLDDALRADQESETVDFKTSLDVNAKSELLEVIKDIIAMANSGGGVLLVGVNDDGRPSGHDIGSLLNFDPAKMSNQLFAATGRHFCNFRITAAERETQTIAAVEVGGVPVPLVTVSAGNYHDPHSGRQKTAYSQGVVYFRHGAKSEPGTTEDLERFLKREIEAVRESWLSNVRRAAEAPPGSCIVVLPPDQAALGDGLGVRIVDSPDAPAVSLHEQDWRDQYPYTFKSLTEALRSRYTDFKQNNTYHDIRKPLENDAKYCKTRLLDPDNPCAGFKRYYSPTILEIFDRHYKRLADE